MEPILANIMGPDLLIVGAIVVLLFGGTQLPKLARGLGQAKQEFEKAQKDEPKPAEPPAAAAQPPVSKEPHIEP